VDKLNSSRGLASRAIAKLKRGSRGLLGGAKPAGPAWIEYPYTRFSIRLPADHLLPVYQRQHKLYDRFLPHLAAYLDTGATVIDVGANVGDTLSAMYDANPALSFVCVEPDDTFFELLLSNIGRIRSVDPLASITTAKMLVGKAVASASLAGSGGTKKAVPGDAEAASAIPSRPLDSIVDAAHHANLRLIKSDVDGFDFDVIDSAERLIRAARPLLFFECQLDHDHQRVAYFKTIAGLINNGYRHWVLFDNFGEVVLRTGDLAAIVQLLDYVWRQNLGRTRRTIYYFDVLAACDADADLVSRIIGDYTRTN